MPEEVWKPYPPWPASQKNPVASASNPTTGTPSAASVRSPVQALRTSRIPSVVIVLSRATSRSMSPGYGRASSGPLGTCSAGEIRTWPSSGRK